MNDGSQAPQTDRLFNPASGRHRPDPLNPRQEALGRTWGLVTPFALNNVAVDAPLAPPPTLASSDYAAAYNQVVLDGKDNIVDRDPAKVVVGIFWGYDGANKIGVPPRLYNQVVRAIPEFKVAARPKYKASFTLRQAIHENNISRIYLGVHWDFDATGGEKVGVAIADKVSIFFK
jgi:hypothetical protein